MGVSDAGGAKEIEFFAPNGSRPLDLQSLPRPEVELQAVFDGSYETQVFDMRDLGFQRWNHHAAICSFSRPPEDGLTGFSLIFCSLFACSRGANRAGPTSVWGWERPSSNGRHAYGTTMYMKRVGGMNGGL